jgi:putative DNA methylase
MTTDTQISQRKLIEVALPLEAINRESAREKSIRHGHPSTLHLWWARRPLAAARAVLFAQLVDDPSSRPEEFPTQDDQRRERDRLHELIRELVRWDNSQDTKLLSRAYAEILKSCDGKPPAIIDPFAGGGTIPLEAQRLGLMSYASDINPVAVLINKALVEIPPKFADQPPIFPGKEETEFRTWRRSQGLAADVRAYGTWMRDEALRRIGSLYPKVMLPNGTESDAIAWIWARTIACPNPACRIDMPLVRSWWLGKKKGKEVYVVPLMDDDPTHVSGRRVRFEIRHGAAGAPEATADGTVSGRTGAICVACDATASIDYLRAEGLAHRIGKILMAIVAEGDRKRIYVAPNDFHSTAADIERPEDTAQGEIANNPRWFSPPAYGITNFSDLLTNRQIVAMNTLSNLTIEARDRVIRDGGASDYADAVATYLGFSVSKALARNNVMCGWESGMDRLRGSFQRQAIPMTWDYAEANPLSTAGGGFVGVVESEGEVLDALVPGRVCEAIQADAATRSFVDYVMSTDPPYYDNIGYSDLSDFFYVWLRRTLRPIYPELLATMQVPKADELVANPYRHGGRNAARQFFEDGFRRVFSHARASASEEFPITVYYAFKQSERDDAGQVSTGWETLLEGMIDSGWTITSTWPNRSELASRMIGKGTNALASSIVLSLRPRPDDSPTIDRRGFIAALEGELPDALRKLQQGEIAPVDLPQAAIGPGMAVFSRYRAVLEPDGKPMTVRSALARINEILDRVLNEQEGDFDATSRFAIAWYRQHGYESGKYGDAELLANARGTVVQSMDRDGVLVSRGGKVNLIRPPDLSWDYDVVTDLHTSNWEVLHHLIKTLEREGIVATGDFLQAALSRLDGAVDTDLVKELAHLLFRIAESNGWTKDALSFNSLVTSWPEILDVARADTPMSSVQSGFDFSEEDD